MLAVLSFALLALCGQASATFPAGSNSFSSAPLVTATNDTSFAFDLSGYTAEANEPFIGSQSPARSAWWRWTAPANGFVIIETLPVPDVLIVTPPTVDPLIGVYSGNNLGSLTPLANSDNRFAPFQPLADTQARVIVPVTSDQQIRFKVDADTTFTVGVTIVGLRFFAYGARSYEGAISIGFGKGQQAGISLAVTAAGKVTGKLRTPEGTFPFIGTIGAAGQFELGMPNAPVTNPVTLVFDLANGTGPLRIAMYDVSGGEEGFLYPRTKFTNAPPDVAGKFTAVLDTGRSGFLAGNISPQGVCTFAGKTGDGTPVTFAGSLVEEGAGIFRLPFLKSLFAKKGFIVGGLRFSDGGPAKGTPDSLDATGFENRYSRPQSSSVFLPNGVQATFTVAGGSYVPPAPGEPALNFLKASGGGGKLTVVTAGAEITGFVENLTFGAANTFAFASQTRKPVLMLNKNTGLVTGTLLEPSTIKRKLTGILAGGTMPVLKGFVSGATTTTNFQVAP